MKNIKLITTFFCVSIVLSSFGMKKYSKLKAGPACILIRSLHQKKTYKCVPQEVRLDVNKKNIGNAVGNFDCPCYYYVFKRNGSIVCAYYLSQRGDVIWLKDKKNNEPQEFHLNPYLGSFPQKVRYNKKDLKFVGYDSAQKILLTVWGVKNLFAGVWHVNGNKLQLLGTDYVTNFALVKETKNSMELKFSQSIKKIKQGTFPIQK